MYNTCWFFILRVTDVIISGPLNITKHTLSTGEYAIRWTPTRNDLGDHFPVCFIAESVSGWVNYCINHIQNLATRNLSGELNFKNITVIIDLQKQRLSVWNEMCHYHRWTPDWLVICFYLDNYVFAGTILVINSNDLSNLQWKQMWFAPQTIWSLKLSSCTRLGSTRTICDSMILPALWTQTALMCWQTSPSMLVVPWLR